MTIKVCGWGINMNYPLKLVMAAYDCSHCFMVSFSRHCHPQSCIHEHRRSAHTRGLWHPSFWFCLFSLSHMYFFPSCHLHRVIGFLKQFVLKAKATQLRLPLALSQSLFRSLSLPALFSQGLVLVLIKALSFCLVPAFSTARCELRGNSDTE